jgi:hypothetical protein
METQEKITLKLLRIPKWERQHQERIENLEFEVQRLQHEPPGDESFSLLADAERRLALLKAEEPVYRYATGGPTKEVRVGEIFDVWPTFGNRLLQKDDERVKAAKEKCKNLSKRLEKVEKLDESPERKIALALLKKELSFFGNDKSMEKFRMFEVVKSKDKKLDDQKKD